MVRIRRGVLPVLAVSAAVSLAAGCSSSSGYDRAGNVARNMETVKAELRDIAGQINRLVATARGFETVAKQGSLKTHYDQFVAESRTLGDQTARIRSRAEDLRSRRDAYLEAWEQELAEVKSDGVRAASAERREAIAAAFGEVEQVVRGVRESYRLFVEDVEAIRIVLGNDLTEAGVKSVEEPVEKLGIDGPNVVKGVNAIVDSLERAAKQLPALQKPAK
jgi:uncharacterized protein YukE